MELFELTAQACDKAPDMATLSSALRSKLTDAETDELIVHLMAPAKNEPRYAVASRNDGDDEWLLIRTLRLVADLNGGDWIKSDVVANQVKMRGHVQRIHTQLSARMYRTADVDDELLFLFVFRVISALHIGKWLKGDDAGTLDMLNRLRWSYDKLYERVLYL